MKTNFSRRTPAFAFERTSSSQSFAYQQLRRISMACMLWEDTFYVDGKKHIEILEEACKKVEPQKILDLAIEVKEKGLLRHLPLYLILKALKKGGKGKEAIARVCTRPDQMTELLSLYWKDGKKPLAAQLKKGLAQAFTKFDEYSLAKYNRSEPIKLKDVLFLCHAKPISKEQEELWKRLISGSLKTPDTWEVRLSAGENKKECFVELLQQNKIGKLAILRNLRNMYVAGVDKILVKENLLANKAPLLPFQFLAAASAVPAWEDIVDEAMVLSIQNKDRLLGDTVIFVDVSESMTISISGKSHLTRFDAACGIAILLREICSNPRFLTFSNFLRPVPSRRGMALRDAIKISQPMSATYLGAAISTFINSRSIDLSSISRIIIITDEQALDTMPSIKHVPGIDLNKCYIVNIGTDQNGLKDMGEWKTIHGFSESVIDYICEIEKE